MIIEEISEVRKYIAINVNNNFDVISPYLLGAEARVIKVVSSEQWSTLETDYAANSNNADHLKLLELAQAALVQFAYLDFSFDGSFELSDSGFANNSDNESRPLYQWEKIEFRKQRYKKGWEYLERIFLLLNGNKAAYPDWAGSATYQTQKGNFIFTHQEFNKYRTIDGYATLMALVGAMTEVEDSFIKRTIGVDLYNELKDQVLNDTLSADNEALLPYIKEAVTHLAVHTAGEELQFGLTENGLRINSTETQSGNIAKDVPANDTQLAIVFQKSRLKGQEALEELSKYLNSSASATKYPLYFNSSLYVAADENATGKFKNTQKKSFSKVWF